MSIKNSSISVIIVNFNAGKYLINCVQSVINEAIVAEVIISDNASTDNSISLLRRVMDSHPKLFIQENNNNLGFSRGNNVVLSKATGKYLLFLNPDCIVKSGTLNLMKEIMDTHLQAGMSGCLIRNTDNSIQATCVRSIPTPWNSLVRILHLNRIFTRQKLFRGLDLATQALPQQITPAEGISGAFMFVRREALKTVGLLDEKYFLYCEDLDWMLRFQQAGWQILFVPDVEVIHIKGVCGQQVPLKVLWHKHRGMMRFYHKFFQQKYSIILMILIYLAVWTRFSVLILKLMLQKIFRQNVTKEMEV